VDLILSQKHKVVEVGRHLWRSSGPAPLFMQGHLELVVQDHIQLAFRYFQGGGIHNFPEQPMPVLSHPDKKSVFPDIQTESPVFHCPLPLVLSLGITEKSGSILFAPSLQVFICIDEILTEPSVFQVKQSQPCQPFFVYQILQTLNHLDGPSLESLQEAHVSLVLRSPGLDTVLQVWPHQC